MVGWKEGEGGPRLGVWLNDTTHNPLFTILEKSLKEIILLIDYLCATYSPLFEHSAAKGKINCPMSLNLPGIVRKTKY